MDFTEVLNPRTIVTHLKVNQKAEALEAMAELFAEAGIIGDKEQYIKDVYVREEMGATGIGGYIAIPHGKSKAVITPGAAIAVLDHEIEWESLDGAGAKVIILFAGGRRAFKAFDNVFKTSGGSCSGQQADRCGYRGGGYGRIYR